MLRLIDADVLERIVEEKFHEHYGATVYQFMHDFFRFIIRQIRKAPTIDPESIRPHGQWVEYDCYKCNSDGEPVIKTATVLVCSVCGREERYREPYCHCGAKMDLEEDDV